MKSLPPTVSVIPFSTGLPRSQSTARRVSRVYMSLVSDVPCDSATRIQTLTSQGCTVIYASYIIFLIVVLGRAWRNRHAPVNHAAEDDAQARQPLSQNADIEKVHELANLKPLSNQPTQGPHPLLYLCHQYDAVIPTCSQTFASLS